MKKIICFLQKRDGSNNIKMHVFEQHMHFITQFPVFRSTDIGLKYLKFTKNY